MIAPPKAPAKAISPRLGPRQNTSHDGPVAGVPEVLFQTRIIASRLVLFQYAGSPGGERFLINSMPSVGAAPLTVLTK